MDFSQPGAAYINTAILSELVTISASNVQITNAGSGRMTAGLVFATGGSSFTNESGAILRPNIDYFDWNVVALTGSSGADTVINQGAINGVVLLGDGNDTMIETAGAANYLRDMGAGDDSFTLEHVSSSYFVLDGGAGRDLLTMNDVQLYTSAAKVSGFEEIRISAVSGWQGTLWSLVGAEIIDFTGPQQELVSSATLSIVQSDLQAAVVRLHQRGGLNLFNSTIGEVTGDQYGNSLSLSGTSRVLGNVTLGDGMDNVSVDPAHGAEVLGSIDGGAGSDSFFVTQSEAGEHVFSMARIRGFEDLRVGSSLASGTQANLILTEVPGVQAITLNGGTQVTFMASDLSSTTLLAYYRNSITLGADVVLGRFGDRIFHPASELPDDRFSLSLTNAGIIQGDASFGIGDDLYDGRNGAVGGVVIGLAGNDTLLGGNGRETFNAGSGYDHIDGGSGVDLAIYAKARTETNVTREPDRSLVISSTLDGTDTVRHVEQFQFADGLYSFTFANPSGVPVVANFNPAFGWASQDQYPRHVADVNGDGYADIVGFGTAGVLVSFGSAGGSFTGAAVKLADFGQNAGWATDNGFHRELADVNGDGRADILGFGFAGTLVSLARADGTFGAVSTGITDFGVNQGWANQNGFARTVGDVNGDGKADIVGFGFAGALVALGNGNGTFQPVKTAIANFGANQGWTSDNSFHRAVADVNGDGRADIVGFGIAGTYVALANADGTFANAQLVLNDFGANQGWSSNDSFSRLVVDLNGDHIADLVGFGIAGTLVAFGKGDGTFTQASLDVSDFGKAQGWSSDNTFHREVADVNKDGLADIVGFGIAGILVGQNQGDFLI